MSILDMGGDPGRGFEERPGLSRRQLVRAGVWAAPVIVLATSAPAAATSPEEPVPSQSLSFSNPGEAPAVAVWAGGGTGWGTPGRIFGNFWIKDLVTDPATGAANSRTAITTVVVTRSDSSRTLSFGYSIPPGGQASENPFTFDIPDYTPVPEITVTFSATAPGFAPVTVQKRITLA